ncbi:hypothetical protein B0H11DRAFT_1969754 [Mycena galericulata]|nr:hypothetical protein B0H11DRAFT_1969754 [Mycena galericulata]
MSLEEAVRWIFGGPLDPEFRSTSMDPDIRAVAEQKRRAWFDDNRATLREAMGVLIAARPDRFAPGATLDHTGSYFCKYEDSVTPVYWNPAVVEHNHEGFWYYVSTPHRVAALHAISDEEPAVAYVLAHYDRRVPVEPLRLFVRRGWDAWNVRAAVVEASAHKEARPGVRYTLSDWRKLRALYDMTMRGDGLVAVQRYYMAHYDLKEVLDEEGRVVSSERGGEYVPVSRL